MASQKQSKAQTIYQLKISLKDSRPPIWRRVQVLNTITLGQLHWVIQKSMGWTNSHLHSFNIQGVEYGMPMPDFGMDDMEFEDERSVVLHDIIPGDKFKFSYLYDFGDSWEHEMLVEKILEANPNITYPICTQGIRACPPEDCGGVWGYEELLEAIQDSTHPEHEEMLDWVGGNFDPEDAGVGEANTRLKMIPEY